MSGAFASVMCITMIEPFCTWSSAWAMIAGTEVPNASPLGSSYWMTVTPVGAIARNAVSS